MPVRASDAVTLVVLPTPSYIRTYYLIQASTLAAPGTPTTNPPASPWSTTEPAYTAGSTDTLYTVQLTVWGDGTFDYGPVQKSSAFEAAKQAYNAAQAASTAAGAALLAANGKNIIIRSTAAASNPGNYSANDMWWRYSGSQIIAMWIHSGTAWVSQTLTDSVITNLNASTITAGTLGADRIGANSITASKLLISGSNLVPNPDFNVNTGWTGSEVSFSVGTYSTGRGALLNRTSNLERSITSEEFVLAAGQVYTAGGRVLSQATSVNLRIEIIPVSTAGVDQTPIVVATGGSSSWTTVQGQFTPNASTYRGYKFRFVAEASDSATGNDYIVQPHVYPTATGEMIVNGTISTLKLAAGAVTADKITAGTITGDKIAAGTISASRLLISNLDNLVEDPGFEYSTTSGVAWTLGTGSVVSTSTPRTGARSLQITTATSARVAATSVNAFSVEQGEQYRISFWVRLSSGTSATGGIAARVTYGSTEASTPTASDDIALTPAGTGTTYVRATGVWTVPANAKFARLAFVSRDVVASKVYRVDDVSVTKMASGELIVDGAVTADKIAANSITAEKLSITSTTDTMVANGSFEEDLTCWAILGTPTGGTVASVTTPVAAGLKALRLVRGAGTGDNDDIYFGQNQDNYIPVSPGTKLYISTMARASAAAAEGYNVTVNWYQTNKTTPVADSPTSSVTNNAPLTTEYQKLEGTVEAPIDAAWAQIVLNNSLPSATFYVDDVKTYAVAVSAMIGDGAIYTQHLQAEAVTAEAIAANAITAQHIDVDAIETQHIRAGQINTTHLAAGFEQELTISAGQVTLQSGGVERQVQSVLEGMEADVAANSDAIESLGYSLSVQDEGVFIQKPGSEMRLRLDEDGIEIQNSGTPVSEWNSEGMLVKVLTAQSSAKIGNHRLESDGDGGTVFKRETT